jgi:uroporphyrin-III C-methyltransferase
VSDANQSDVQLNDAFKRLEAQVAENQSGSTRTRPSESSASVNSVPSSGANISGIVGTILGLVALGVASFAAYNSWQVKEVLGQSNATAQISDLSGRLSQLTQQVNRSEGNFSGVVTQLEATSTANDAALLAIEERVSEVVAGLRQQLGTSSEDWLIAEAEYLLRLANQRVAMEDDAAGAIKLFEAADQIIREAEGIVAFELREAIAMDIAALRGVSNVDIQGIFVELGALAGQIDVLEQKRLQYVPPVIAEQNATESEQQSLTARALAFLVRIGDRLASLVDYRNDGESIKPILPPEEEYYLKQNLALKIQLVQLGLLRGNQEIYEQSLLDAVEWVDQYFNSEASLTLSVRESLARLSGVDVSRNLPEVSGSLREIRKLMSQFHESADRAAP